MRVLTGYNRSRIVSTILSILPVQWMMVAAISISLFAAACGGDAGADQGVAVDLAQAPDQTVPDLAQARDQAMGPAPDLASSCDPQQMQGLCCCQGDIIDNLVCSGGQWACRSGFQKYSGSACTAPCGPCSLPCLDLSAPRDLSSGGG